MTEAGQKELLNGQSYDALSDKIMIVLDYNPENTRNICESIPAS